MRYFRDLGDRLMLISFYPAEPIDGIDLVHIPGRGRYSPLFKIAKVKQLITEFKPDILHAHYASSCGLVAALSGFHPMIISVWGDDILVFPKKSPLHLLAIKKALLSADHITATSMTLARETEKIINGKRRLTVIPFGVDTRLFSYVDRESKNTITIGTVRNLTPKYGIDVLIKAFGELCQERNDLRLKIVGDGPSRQYLQQLANNLGIADKVEFVGKIPNDSVFDQMKAMDIFAIPSVGEGETFGVAAVEAMATGLPVVASNIGGLPEVVENDVTGILTTPGDCESLRKALEFYILNRERRIKDGIMARKAVERKYDWLTNASLMNELYDNLLKSRLSG